MAADKSQAKKKYRFLVPVHAGETEKDGAIHYEFKFTDQSGRKQEVEYDGSGNPAHEEK